MTKMYLVARAGCATIPPKGGNCALKRDELRRTSVLGDGCASGKEERDRLTILMADLGAPRQKRIVFETPRPGDSCTENTVSNETGKDLDTWRT